MKTKHYILIAVAAIAVWYFFIREKKEQPVGAPAVQPIPRTPSAGKNDGQDMVPQGMKIPQQTAQAFRRPGTSSSVIAGININTGTPVNRIFNDRKEAVKHYFNAGGTGAGCTFVELNTGQYEVNCP